MQLFTTSSSEAQAGTGWAQIELPLGEWHNVLACVVTQAFRGGSGGGIVKGWWWLSACASCVRGTLSAATRRRM